MCVQSSSFRLLPVVGQKVGLRALVHFILPGISPFLRIVSFPGLSCLTMRCATDFGMPLVPFPFAAAYIARRCASDCMGIFFAP